MVQVNSFLHSRLILRNNDIQKVGKSDQILVHIWYDFGIEIYDIVKC